MSGKKINLDTLSQVSKKKKDFLILAGLSGVVGLIVFSIFTYSLDIDEKKVYHKKDMEITKNSKLNITPTENIKESWAISVENKFKEQTKFIVQSQREAQAARKENQKILIDLIKSSQEESDKKFFQLNSKLDSELANLRKENKEAILKQDNRIEELKLTNKSGVNFNLTNSNPDEDIQLGDDLLPQIKPHGKDEKDLLYILNGNSKKGKDGKDGKITIGTDGNSGLTGIDGFDGVDNSNTYNPDGTKRINKIGVVDTIFNIENIKGIDTNDILYKIKTTKEGKDIIVDQLGKPLTVKRTNSGVEMTDQNGNTLFVNKIGETLKIREDVSGNKIIVNEGTKKAVRMRKNTEGETIFITKVPGTKENPNEKKVKVSLFDIDTKSVKKYQLAEKEKELRAIKKRIKDKNTYHIMTGLTKAYLITGVYAPAFSEGKSDPLPVLLQAEGDILIANDDTESIEKCFFLASAKGNMNSETADIRLNKISCSLSGGTKKIEGAISGWVIGENGIPGVPGELLHKNGAWLAKTFVAGFLDTFAQTMVSYASSGRGARGTGGSITVGDSLTQAGAQSTSDVFQKIGDYYLKMAEQIFPVIEVKPGRTVDILLKGGDTLTITDFNSAEINQIENDIILLREQQDADQGKLIELGESGKVNISSNSGVTVKSGSSNKVKKIDLFN